MLKSCKYCGRIHDKTFDCGKKPAIKKKDTKAVRFRNQSIWKKKAEEIKKRDKYLCQVCIRNLYDTDRTLNYMDLSVHHIIPIEKDYEKRLDNDNLITLCRYHHDLAERAIIKVSELMDICLEQNEKTSV